MEQNYLNGWPIFDFKRPRQGPNRAIALLLHTLSEAVGPNQKPSVLQIGANDGRLDDPLYPFFKNKGWEGWLFEPHPIYFSELRVTYGALPNVRLFNCGVSDQERHVDLYHLSEEASTNYPRWLRGCASLDKHRFLTALNTASIRRGIEVDDTHIEKTNVDLRRMDRILKSEEISSVDAIVIDVEGHELSVLNSFVLSEVAPKLVILEANSGDVQIDQACTNKMKDAGLIVFRVGPELVGLRPDLMKVEMDRVLYFLNFTKQ